MIPRERDVLHAISAVDIWFSFVSHENYTYRNLIGVDTLEITIKKCESFVQLPNYYRKEWLT